MTSTGRTKALPRQVLLQEARSIEKRLFPHSADSEPADPAERKAIEGQSLATAVGREIRNIRLSQNMTGAMLAKAAGVSTGMLSKIERGLTGLSFATLDQLAATLNVPVSRLFVSHKEGANFSLVKANEGIGIDRRGSKVGMKYELIGHLISGEKFVEPYLVTISNQAAPGPGFQHTGIQFIHMLTGSMIYRYADEVVDLHPGDTLVFDGSAVHGQEQLLTETVTCIMAFFYLRG